MCTWCLKQKQDRVLHGWYVSISQTVAALHQAGGPSKAFCRVLHDYDPLYVPAQRDSSDRQPSSHPLIPVVHYQKQQLQPLSQQLQICNQPRHLQTQGKAQQLHLQHHLHEPTHQRHLSVADALATGILTTHFMRHAAITISICPRR